MTMTQKLRYFVDDRGHSLFDVLPVATDKGQINLSYLAKDSVKAFHLHENQSDFIVCISGKAKLVIANSDWTGVEEYYLTPIEPVLIAIPPSKWYGYKALEENTIILYYVTNTYDPVTPDERRARWDSLGKEIWEVSKR